MTRPPPGARVEGRSSVQVLRMAPWWRGPALLLRRAGVALALAAAALVATLPASAVTPFLASSRSATLHHQIAADCPTAVGLNVAAPLTFAPSLDRGGELATNPSNYAEQQRRIAASAGSVTGLGAGIEAVTGLLVATGGQRPDAFHIQAMSRPGFADHVTPLAPPQGTGVWIPQTYAEAAGLRAGDTLTLSAGSPSPGYLAPGYDPGTGSVQVAAIYRDLRSEPPTPWWCGVRSLFDPPVEAEGGTPPLVLFDDPAALLGIGTTTWATRFTHYAQYPLADPQLSIGTAHQVSSGVSDAIADLHGQSLLGAAQVTSDLVTFVNRAELARSGMLPTVLPVTGVGVLVGLLVVAAAALFWVQRRRRELTILSAHGVGARSLGLKAVLEALPALLLGAAAGWGLAWTLVDRAGPDPVLDSASRSLSLLLALAALAVSALVVGFVAALACRSLTDTVRAHHRTVLAALPWELALLAAAYPLWNLLGGGTETSTRDSGGGVVAHVPGRLLVVPILLVAGLAALAARLGVRWLRRQARRRSPAAVGAYLGWRRLGRQALGSALLGAAVAVPIALAAYGAAVTGSVRATIEGEAKLRNGSDVVITLTHPAPLPSAFAGHGTELLRLDGALVGGVSTNILAVDPDTFAQGAFWTGSVDGESMRSLLAALRGGGVDVLAAAPVPDGPQPASYAGQDILGGSPTVRQLPALPVSGAYPSAIVLRQDLDERAAQSAVTQIWVKGDPVKIHDEAVAAGLPIGRVTVAGDLYANTVWEPLTYSFSYLTALSLLTGVVTVVGLLLYLEAQAPVHRRAYVLLRRMGLRPRSHRRALVGEIGYPMVAGLIFGLAVAGVLTWVLRADIEMNPTIPPATIVAWPFAPVGLIALAVLLAMVGATAYAHRRISRARPTEVLRDTVG